MSELPTPTNCAIARELLRDALPIWAFYLTEILVGLTDLAVVGALRTDALAAVGLGKTVLLSFLTVGFAAISFGTVLMAETLSAERCGAVLGGSLIIAMAFAVLAVMIAVATPPLLTFSGYEASLIDLFRADSSVLGLAIGPAMAFAALKNVLVAHGRTGVIAWLSFGIVIANLAGSVLLVHGAGQWQGLGVSGAAWATVGVNIAAAAALFVLTIRWRLVRFAVGTARAAVARSVEIAALGWPVGAQQLLESLLFVAVLYLLGLYSPVWLAAGTLAFAIMELNYAASAALGEVLAARLVKARTCSDHPALLRLMRLGTAMTGAGAIVLALFVLIFPIGIIGIFSGSHPDESALALMASMLQWTAPFFLFDAWQVVCAHALRGLRRAVGPMLISSGCYWVIGLGGGLFLAEILLLGAAGIWVGFCMGLVCAASVLVTIALREVGMDGHRR